MLTTEFSRYFTEKNFFLGCYSSDNYPKSLKRDKEFFVVNKDPSYKQGSHWMVVFLNNGVVEFFDSAGTTENTVVDFLTFDKTFDCMFNETPLQPLNSTSCGEFCVFFAKKRLKDYNLTYCKFLNKYFSINLEKNNKTVLNYCKNYFPF